MNSLAAVLSLFSLGLCSGRVGGRDGPSGADDLRERTAFTSKLAGYYQQVHYYQWLLDTSHGVDASTGQLPWSMYWTDMVADTSGGEVTFRALPGGGADNIMIPTARVLGHAAAAYLWTNDAAAARLAEQYANGVSATMLGMVWDRADTTNSIMARALFPERHSFDMPDGRRKHVDYDAWRTPTVAWNTHTIAVPGNPYWRNLWVKNIRSKDDLPHLFLAAAILPFVAAQSDDPALRDAARQAYTLLQGFTRDIVTHGYWIRSRRDTGELYYPGLPPDTLSDLASFSLYRLPLPSAECDARLSAALLGYDEPQGESCGDGVSRIFELEGAHANFYNYLIYSTFHLSAAMNARVQGKDELAEALTRGLSGRVDFDFNLRDDEIPQGQVDQWRNQLATFIVYAAAAGMPVQTHHALLVRSRFAAAIDAMIAWDGYDPWALPDGRASMRPDGIAALGSDAMGAFAWYCWSPYRSGDVSLVDCDRLKETFR